MIAGFDRYFQIALLPRRGCPRRPPAGRVLPARPRNELRDPGGCVRHGRADPARPVPGGGKPVTKQFPRITYAEAMRKYGTDKPDLRNPIEMQDVTEHFRGSGFKVFAGMLDMDANARIWAIPGKGGGSRAVCDRMNAWAQEEGSPASAIFSSARAKGGRSPRMSAPRGQPRSGLSWACRRRRRVLRGGIAGRVRRFRRPRPRQDRQRASTHGEGPIRVLLDRRFSHV